LIEAGIHGGSTAAPITRDILKTYFDKKTRSALPKPTDVASLFGLKH